MGDTGWTVRQLLIARIVLSLLIIANTIIMVVLFNLNDYDYTYVVIHAVVYLVLVVALVAVTCVARNKAIQQLRSQGGIIAVGVVAPQAPPGSYPAAAPGSYPAAAPGSYSGAAPGSYPAAAPGVDSPPTYGWTMAQGQTEASAPPSADARGYWNPAARQ